MFKKLLISGCCLFAAAIGTSQNFTNPGISSKPTKTTPVQKTGNQEKITGKIQPITT